MADQTQKPAPVSPPLKDAPATQKISKQELADLIKKAEEADSEIKARPTPPKK